MEEAAAAATRRSHVHHSLSKKLASLDDASLASLLEGANPLGVHTGGASALLSLDGHTIFVKKIPLTALEQRPEHFRSTANLFGLPLVCQYRVGGPGFGVWRELETHLLTTDWVLSGKCASFPLLHHWRALPGSTWALNKERLQKYVRYWESPAVRARLEAMRDAASHVTLFLEYVPENLHQWLAAEIAGGRHTCVELLDRQLTEINTFMGENGLTHFDAHFENVLTDGHQLYFTDFGLALSSSFELTEAEREFLELHRGFDRSNTALSFVISLVLSLPGEGAWEERLRGVLERTPSPSIGAILARDAPVALALKDFLRKFSQDKTTPYPATLLERLLRETRPGLLSSREHRSRS